MNNHGKRLGLKHPTHEQRVDAIRRVLAGELPESLAYNLGVDTLTVERWVKRWGKRYGDDAAALQPDLEQFLQVLRRSPGDSRKWIESAWQALDEQMRSMLTPAFDTYLIALDMADEARRTRMVALDLFAREIVTRQPAQQERAA